MMIYLVTNVANAIILSIGFIFAVYVIDRYVFKAIDFLDELKKKNMAVAVFLGSLFIAVAVLVRNG